MMGKSVQEFCTKRSSKAPVNVRISVILQYYALYFNFEYADVKKNSNTKTCGVTESLQFTFCLSLELTRAALGNS